MKLKTYEAPRPVRQTASPHIEVAHRELDIRDKGDRDYAAGVVAMGQAATLAWDNYEAIGEVRYPITKSAKIAGYAEIGAERRSGKGEVTQTKRDSPTVQAIVDEITSRFGGTRGLIQRYYTLMKVPGEGFLIRFRDEHPDGYWFLSPDEIDRGNLGVTDPATLTDPITWKTARIQRYTNGSEDAFTRKVQPDDFYGRVWMPSNRYVDETESPMEAVAPLCEMLRKLTTSIMARIESRFASAGILLVPSEMNDAAVGGEQPSARLYSQNKVLNYFIHSMTVNMATTGKALDRMPIAAMGPADVLDKVRHMIFDAKVDEVDLKLRVELIGRILAGLDQNKGSASDNEDSSHWGAWANAQEEYRTAVEPELEQLDHILTRMVLWKELKALDWEPARIRPWRIVHDLNEAAIRVNQAEDFRQMWDRGEISGKALRRAGGAKSTDMPTPQERVQQFGWKYGDPYLAFYGLKGIEIQYDKVGALRGGKTGPNADSPADDSPEGPGVSDPGSPNDRDSDAPKSEEPG